MNTFRQNLMIYKMAWLKAGLIALVAGFNSLQTSLSGLQWDLLKPTEQFLILNGFVIAIATSLIGFLDRTLSRITDEQKALTNAPQPTETTVTTKTTP